MADIQELYKELDAASEAYNKEPNAENGKRFYDVSLEISKQNKTYGDYLLGQCYLYGFGTKPDAERGIKHLEAAIAEGDVGAYCILGRAYYDGSGVEQDTKRAYGYLREGAERGDADCEDAVVNKLYFSADDKRPWEESHTEKKATDGDIAEWTEKANNGSAVAAYLAAKYYYDKQDKKTAKTYAKKGADKKFFLADDLFIWICREEMWESWDEVDEIYKELRKNGVPLSDGVHEPNAVLVPINSDAGLVPIYIEDFSTSASLGKPIDADRISIISTENMKKLTERLGSEISLVGFCDRHGAEKHLRENERAEELSGYPTLVGDCVICGYESNDYVPLEPIIAATLAEWINRGGKI